MSVTTADVGEVLEGTAVELHQPVPAPPAAPVTLAVMPTVKATELVARLDVIKEAAADAMQEGVDFGTIPGTNKPTLLKPGAEKLGVLFQLDVQLANEKVWGPEAHLTVISHATVFHAPSGARLGYGEGICTTRERKYAYRKQERVCPACSMPAVIAGKPEYGGGWLCWGKRGGCGAKFSETDPQITGQEVGEIANPDLPDLWNTVVKMAEKRARVDAVLAVTGASAIFTQDAEDLPQPTPTPGQVRERPGQVVSAQDVEQIKAAMRGLTNRQLKDAFEAVGLDATKPLASIPREKAVPLVAELAAVADVQAPEVT